MKAVTVTVANGDRLTAASIGSATFPGVQGTETITGALKVHGLHKNQISVPKLIEKSSSLKMPKYKCTIESKRVSVMVIPKSGSLYVTECLMVVTDPPAPETVTMIDKKFTFAVESDAKMCLVTLVQRQLLLFPKRKWFCEFQSSKRIKTFALAVLWESLTAGLFDPAGGTVLNPAKGSRWTSKLQYK